MLPVSTKTAFRYDPPAARVDELTEALAKAKGDDKKALKEALAQANAALDAAGPARPVYLLAVATPLQRAAWRRDIRAAGAHYPSNDDMLQSLRDDLGQASPPNLDHLLAMIDAAGAPATDTPVDLTEIEALVRRLGGAFAELEGAREYFGEVASYMACRHFLQGWENRDEPFLRHRDQTSDASLEVLAGGDILLIGAKAISLLSVSKAQAKN